MYASKHTNYKPTIKEESEWQKNTVKYHRSSQKNGGNIFGITTNGTIINDEIYKTLVNDFKYSLTISIDGNKLTHDLNRKYINGNGSYDEAIRTAVKLLKVRPDLRVRMTINTETVDSLYENILSLKIMVLII